MAKEAQITGRLSPEKEQLAAQRAKDRTRAARWDIDVAVFFFAVLIIVIILLFQGIVIGIVGPVAAVGLAMGWLMGWGKARQLYQRFYDEELSKLRQELKETTYKGAEETVEGRVQEALRKRW
jgi:hypothetical protein